MSDGAFYVSVAFLFALTLLFLYIDEMLLFTVVGGALTLFLILYAQHTWEENGRSWR